ncbi:UbiH/UbiF/VisC/COQ6 family ubiquinone biosynthesis hydroxylase [Falsirhodobacter sp. alg1]|uniref:UbiH/UbiF/VisC/COQ6 family ubiquinone biosynthesis hydroxylase n=1 Tax=Falsirhodobacter sp. alg1 TaxID=1472418 RepID=UPI0007896C85|nr:UbiH/UbiF/VisC/COQ6 family ubiquinone biosynthesis hydroxylase [Falsirhodobacter sp. alg1]
MKQMTDIVIVGGGLNGPSLALGLAQAGFDVMLVDARPAPARAERGFDGRAYSLAIASRRLLQAIGVWRHVAERAEPILRIRAGDGRVGHGASPFVLGFDHAEIEEGPMGFMLEDRFLYAALRSEMANEPRIDLRSGETVTDQGTGWVRLGSGERVTARLVVGCDGRSSETARLAGIRRNEWDYRQTALVTAVHHERPHGGTAHQVFMPSGPMAILPLLGGHMSSIVWSEERNAATAISALDNDGFLAALRPRFGDFLGEIALAGDRFTYPLSLSLAERFVAPRVALVGDSAHGVHPLAGQGLNLGLRDVGALVDVLVDASRRGEDIGALDVLQRYQDWRRGEVTTMALGMDAMNRLFSNDNPVLRLGRDLGLGAVNALPGLRRRLIRQAAGLSGRMPTLLR